MKMLNTGRLCTIKKEDIIIGTSAIDSDGLNSLLNEELKYVEIYLKEIYGVRGNLKAIYIHHDIIEIILEMPPIERAEYEAFKRMVDVATYWSNTASNFTLPAKDVLSMVEYIQSNYMWNDWYKYLLDSLATEITNDKPKSWRGSARQYFFIILGERLANLELPQ